MLQVYVFGPTAQGYLDIDPGTSLQLESLMPEFDEELTIGDFTVPADFPWTDNNRKLLGFAERLENFNKSTKEFKCIVYESGFPELPNAKFTILEKSGTFSYTRGKFSASISGSKGLFGSLVKNKYLTDLSLGGTINWSGRSSRQFAEDVMKGVHPEYRYLSFAPVAIEEFIDTNRPDYDTEFLARDTVNTIVNTGGSSDAWTFDNPSGAAYRDYRTVPFFQLKYVLKKVFSENGYTITGEFLDDPDFDYLVIFNQYALENYSPNNIDFNTQIIPSKHMPKVLIKDWLAALFSVFNMYPDFSGGVNSVTLKYRKKNLTDRRILRLTGFCDALFTSQPDDQNNSDTNGYVIEYSWDSADGFPSDRVKDDVEKDKTLAATVEKKSDLDNLNIGRQLTTDDIAYVQADNLYYQIADATSTPMKWDAFAERMNGYQSGSGDNKIDIAMSTLCTYVEYNATDALYEKQDYVGCRQPGSYMNNKGVRVLNAFGMRIFYIKKLNRNGANVPVSFSWNRDTDNSKIVKYSLAWQGDDGLAANFHTVWQDFRNNAEVVKTKVKSSQKILTDLQNNNCVEINNVLFLPYKIDRVIPMKSQMDIELMVM